ncbi:MAG TPA: hypothetical protein VF950_04600 [Planctomycetota bacterium]
MRRIPLWLKLGVAAWAAVYVPAYLAHYGALPFLWFCNLGNLMLVAGIWLESALLVSMVGLSVLVVDTLWTVDVLGRLLLSRHLIGGTGYMWDAEIPLWIRLISLFHVVNPVLLVFLLRRLGYDRRALPAQTLLCWIVLPVCYFLTPPALNLNWAFGLFGRTQSWMPGGLYLLATMAGYVALLYAPTHLLLRAWMRPAQKEPGSASSC